MRWPFYNPRRTALPESGPAQHATKAVVAIDLGSEARVIVRNLETGASQPVSGYSGAKLSASRPLEGITAAPSTVSVMGDGSLVAGFTEAYARDRILATASHLKSMLPISRDAADEGAQLLRKQALEGVNRIAELRPETTLVTLFRAYFDMLWEAVEDHIQKNIGRGKVVRVLVATPAAITHDGKCILWDAINQSKRPSGLDMKNVAFELEPTAALYSPHIKSMLNDVIADRNDPISVASVDLGGTTTDLAKTQVSKIPKSKSFALLGDFGVESRRSGGEHAWAAIGDMVRAKEQQMPDGHPPEDIDTLCKDVVLKMQNSIYNSDKISPELTQRYEGIQHVFMNALQPGINLIPKKGDLDRLVVFGQVLKNEDVKAAVLDRAEEQGWAAEDVLFPNHNSSHITQGLSELPWMEMEDRREMARKLLATKYHLGIAMAADPDQGEEGALRLWREMNSIGKRKWHQSIHLKDLVDNFSSLNEAVVAEALKDVNVLIGIAGRHEKFVRKGEWDVAKEHIPLGAILTPLTEAEIGKMAEAVSREALPDPKAEVTTTLEFLTPTAFSVRAVVKCGNFTGRTYGKGEFLYDAGTGHLCLEMEDVQRARKQGYMAASAPAKRRRDISPVRRALRPRRGSPDLGEQRGERRE